MKSCQIQTNVALRLTKADGLDSRDLATQILGQLRQIDGIKAIHSMEIGEFRWVESVPDDLTEELILYCPGDDDAPYRVVSAVGKEEGTDINAQQADSLKDDGVVTALFVRHPRSDRYGMPKYANDGEAAALFCADHDFVVLRPEDFGFEVTSEDSRDDTPGCEWFTIKTSASMAQSLRLQDRSDESA